MIDIAELLRPQGTKGTPITMIAANEWERAEKRLPAALRHWAKAMDFAAQPGRLLLAADGKGGLDRVLVGRPATDDPFAVGRLSRQLPPGTYAFEADAGLSETQILGWCLEAYGYGAYGKTVPKTARLVCPAGVDRDGVLRAARATFMVRDLVNAPSSDMGPDELEAAARKLAAAHRAPSQSSRARRWKRASR